MTGRVYLDFETKSAADLKQVGTWAYSEHPTTEVICLCYKIRDAAGVTLCNGEVQEWAFNSHGGSMPGLLSGAIAAGYEFEAHKYDFEFSIWANVMVQRFGWRPIPIPQWRCSMAVCSYYAMPAALDAVCRALGWEGKDPEGSRLITKYSKLYLKTAKPEIPPEDVRKFIDYCKRDVLLEEALSDYLGDLPERELPYFHLDIEINHRGLCLDQHGIEVAAGIVDQRSEALTERFRELTGLNHTQTAKLLVWFAEHGVKLDNMQADYLEELLEGDGIPPGDARDALRLRLQVNKASTKKLDAMARNVGSDGTAKFQSRYHGAGTGRDTGSGFQPLNLVRSWEDVDPDQLVRDVMYGDASWLDALYGDAMEAISKAGRHWIVARPGNRILAGDFVSIEAVVLACMAGEDWKVQAFRDGIFIYGLTACKIHKLDPALSTSKKWFKENYPKEAKDGKTGELAWGYGGGLGAWLKFDSSGTHSDAAIETMKNAWRAEHPMTVAMWHGLEAAAIEAVEYPHRTTGYRDTGFEIVDEWLSMILPNGKRLWYREPELKVGMPQWHNPETKEDCADGTCSCKPRVHLTYKAQKEGQWKRVSTYGGKLTENAVQGASREYLMPSVVAANKAGYPVVLKVYDEVVSDVPIAHGSKAEFEDILKNAPGRDWARGWPIGVDAWEGQRYRK